MTHPGLNVASSLDPPAPTGWSGMQGHANHGRLATHIFIPGKTRGHNSLLYSLQLTHSVKCFGRVLGIPNHLYCWK